ncbi:hypothetical protein Pcinc_033970, partial [Petrolisthes cinctipes]
KRDFRFLCPNNTVFDQQNFICTNWYEIDCKGSTRYYSKNDLFRVDETTTEHDYGDYQQQPYYEYVYEYEDPQSRVETDYAYEYYDTADTSQRKHRFDARARNRQGKSQVGRSNNTSNSLPSSTTTTTTTTSSTTTTTTTTTTTPRPTTTTTTPTTTTTTTRRPLPSHFHITTASLPITTLRPSLSFSSGSFRVGRPVVSITSSTRRGSTSSSGPAVRFGSTSTRATRQEEELNDREVDELYKGVQDPFADIDWRRDSSTSVTASTKTTYEQRFGTVGDTTRTRHNSHLFSTASRNQEVTSTTMRNTRLSLDSSAASSTTTTTTERSNVGSRRSSSRARGAVVRSRGSSGFTSSRARQAGPDPALEEFANFRYYRTAFGKSGGNSDSPTASSPPSSRERAQTSSSGSRSSSTGGRVRPAGYISARSASRNTRYAVYG